LGYLLKFIDAYYKEEVILPKECYTSYNELCLKIIQCSDAWTDAAFAFMHQHHHAGDYVIRTARDDHAEPALFVIPGDAPRLWYLRLHMNDNKMFDLYVPRSLMPAHVDALSDALPDNCVPTVLPTNGEWDIL